jgi:hypothetical protein
MQEVFMCGICFNEVENLVSLGCKSHKFCEECQRDYLKSLVESKNTNFKCMNANCRTHLSLEGAKALLSEAENRRLERTLRSEARRENLISGGQSRLYLTGQLLWGSVRYLMGGFFCPQGGECCLSECLPPVKIEHCPRCHAVVENGNACPHMHCSRRECRREYMRGQQCNIPCYCVTAGCYCPLAIYTTCGIPACIMGYGCCSWVPSYWVKYL